MIDNNTKAHSVLSVDADRSRKKILDGPIKVDKMSAFQDIKTHGAKGWIKGCLQSIIGPGRLTIDEYLYYRLYAESVSEADRPLYVGKGIQEKLHRRCNTLSWYSSVHNKLMFQNILEEAALSRPDLVAVYSESDNEGSTWMQIATGEDLDRYLRSPDTYPIFAKPIDGQYSLGAMLLKNVEGDIVVLGSGSTVRVNDLVNYMTGMSDLGYLFQTPLVAHQRMKAAMGDVLPTARIMVLLDDKNVPNIHASTLKIPVAGNDADNFWRSGNLLARIFNDTGTLGCPVIGVAYEARDVAEHPDTGASLEGFSLPDWQQAQDLVLRASQAFSGIRTQGWDVCFTDEGPVILELNFGGDLNLHQVSHGQGMLDADYCKHLRNCGYVGNLPYSNS